MNKPAQKVMPLWLILIITALVLCAWAAINGEDDAADAAPQAATRAA